MLEASANLLIEIKDQLSVEYPFLSQWSVTFDGAKRRAGMCKIDKKVISLSIVHVEHNSLEVIRDTILHEFAHAIAFEMYGDRGHGTRWKQVAQQIGAEPKARGRFNLPDAPWLLIHLCSKTSKIEPVCKRFRRNKKIAHYFLTGRPETKGELYFVELSQFSHFKNGMLTQEQLELTQ